MHAPRLALPLFLLLLSACGEAGPDQDGAGGRDGSGPFVPSMPTVFPVEAEPEFTPIADRQDGLRNPQDLAFNPGRDGELWILNRADDSVTLVFDATTSASQSERIKDGFAMHFMEEAVAIDFGDRTFQDDYTFGTCGESRNTYDGQASPNDFMGPALWSADLTVFAVANPIGLGSHLDMLHHSPNCMGITHEKDNAYWVFDGLHGKLVRYDFQEDHGPGMDDHSDGIIDFLDQPVVRRQPGVPSHMEWDASAKLLYAVDTGNRRVLRVDPAPARRSRDITPIEPGTVVRELTGAAWSEIVPASAGLELPSGLALHGGVLYVGDASTGLVHAFDLEGNAIATLETGLAPRALAGIEVGPDDRLYVVDSAGPRVLRLER